MSLTFSKAVLISHSTPFGFFPSQSADRFHHNWEPGRDETVLALSIFYSLGLRHFSDGFNLVRIRLRLGWSTVQIIVSSTSLLNSSFSFSFRAVGTHRGGIVTGPTFDSTSRLTLPGKVFSGRLNTSESRWIMPSLALRRHTSASFWRLGVTCMKRSLFTMISFMCWVTCAPKSGLKFCATTTNSAEYFFLGFRIMICVTPRGVISVLFHLTWRLDVGASLELPISSFVITFTDASQSS